MDAESASAQDSQSSGARWADFPGLSDRTKKALMNTFKYEHMTAVQEQVLKYAVSEKDIDLLVRAKTGTGKTLAFLAAGLERVMKSPPAKNKFAMLILSPTRELATQIAGEASKLGRSHDINVVNVIGGDSKTRQLREIDRSGTNAIMVATPGRLIDLLQSNSLVSHKLGEVQVLIFDEADQLLDMGFREDMTRIESYLPKNGRQTFMFSATISKEIKQISEKVLRPRLSKHIDTVPPNEVATHMRIRQSAIVSPFSLQMPLIVDIIRKHRESTENPKIIVFLNTTKLVDYTTKVFSAARPNLEIFQIQSRIESSRRSKISANFRNASDAILFTSDVSARGVDYPNVTLVIQVGAASNTEQYIHRIGRTGRAGKDGEGVLILSPYEEKFLKSVRRVAPVKDENRYDPIVISRETEVVEAVKRACSQMGNKAAQDCYYTYIGYCKFAFSFHFSFLFSTGVRVSLTDHLPNHLTRYAQLSANAMSCNYPKLRSSKQERNSGKGSWECRANPPCQSLLPLDWVYFEFLELS
ncbi:P-loop containing nucleoside triphosphate hydrolase protein [Zopfochytrium polystomum]|nr:P-loop containing nucleoside triphosphate hydrolase protein [Zopfochytrium polystomum]